MSTAETGAGIGIRVEDFTPQQQSASGMGVHDGFGGGFASNQQHSASGFVYVLRGETHTEIPQGFTPPGANMQLSRGSVIQMLETYAYQFPSIPNRSPAMNQDVQAVLDFIDMLQQLPSEDGRIGQL
ncbi:hypothetical protein PR003_g31251 [Phytophthora rubi]|uniref:Uncharacterized protein n=1 Tax=Phytophthora rubi TaxID=129364 RepID=A0A6A3IJC7_9STRA|nr:hypothetical protein PR002_g30451 [Phytophthora rubi]KAE8979823.1 hypothetical protein PR001_g24442 [Phytophthora rubi]KAE9269050.1 hypothetical protein PR003_g31251 [Phytophthora rubi]